MDYEVRISEPATVILQNGNRVVLENGDVVVVASPSIVVSESVGVSVSTAVISVSDSPSLSESATIVISTSVVSVSDSTSTDDSPTYYTDEVIVSESVNVVLSTAGIVVSDSSTVSDSLLIALDALSVSSSMNVVVNINHETGNLTQYTDSSTGGGDLSVTSGAALNGTGYGLSALINDTGAIYARKTLTQSAIVRGRFFIDPNTLVMANNDSFAVQVLMQVGGSAIQFTTVMLEYTTAAGYRLRAQARDDVNAVVVSDTCTITDNPHYVEYRYVQAATNVSSDGTFQWWVDGVSQGTFSGIDNYNVMIDQSWRVAVGACSGLDAGTSGTLFLDELLINSDGSEIGSTPYILDSVKVTESVNLQCPSPIAVSNSISVAESSDVKLDDLTVDILEDSAIYANGVPVDANGNPVIGGPFSIGVGESLSVYIEPLPIWAVAVSDSTSLTDTVISVVNSTCYGAVADAIAISEVVTLTLDDLVIATSDSTSLSESIEASLELEIAVTDGLSVNDTATVALDDLLVAVSDGISVTDTATVSQGGVSFFEVATSDSIGASEEIVVTLEDLTVAVTDSVTTSDTVSVTLDDLTVAVTDGTSVTDLATVELESLPAQTIDVSDSASVSDEIAVVVSDSQVSVTDTTTLSESTTLTVSDSQIAVEDSLAVSESYAVLLLEAGLIVVSTSDTITATDSANATVSTSEIAATDSISSDDTTAVAIVTEVNVSDNTTLGELVTVVLSDSIVTTSDTTPVTDAIAVRLDDLAVDVTDSTVLTDEATVFVEHATYLDVVTIDTTAITEVLSLYNPLTGIAVSDAITVSDSPIWRVSVVHLIKAFVMHIDRGVEGDWQLGYTFKDYFRINQGVVLREEIERGVSYKLKIKRNVKQTRVKP